jgi:acetyl esterase/lipase
LADRGQAQPSFQLLVDPMLDDRSAQGSGPNDHLFRLWDRKSNAIGWDSYLRGHDRAQPPRFAVPARHGDLGRLPPAWIGVGTLDLFMDEGLAYAERLQDGGVTVEVEVVEGAYHGFDGVDRGAHVSRQFRDAQIAAIANHLVGGG